jgi:ubiquinone/menaquinone biosynthesis C-methylase UbiE
MRETEHDRPEHVWGSPRGDVSSADATVARFSTKRDAAKYSRAQIDTPMHRREARCIRAALAGLPRGSHVLDLPSGTGRMFSMLLDMGFRVTGADASAQMIDRARETIVRDGLPGDRIDLKVLDARKTDLPDDAFDAVICNRLLHHIREPEQRRAILRELSRICRGPMVVSFFSKLAIDSLSSWVKYKFRGTKPIDRVPIWPSAFAEDVRSIGGTVERFVPVRPLISKQCYAVIVSCKNP